MRCVSLLVDEAHLVSHNSGQATLVFALATVDRRPAVKTTAKIFSPFDRIRNIPGILSGPLLLCLHM